MGKLSISCKSVQDIHDIDLLGIYSYIQIIMQHETSVLPLIIDKIKEQFNLEESYILEKIKELEEMGLLFVARNRE